jgi:tellurite methyltransferase
MSIQDRDKWNARYLAGDHASGEPSVLLTGAAAWLPSRGKALDLAGGAGRHALWLARRGFEVTLADVSEAGLAIARERAKEADVSFATVQVDLETNPLPPGPWDLIVVTHYLHRPLFEKFPGSLAPGGVLFFLQPTVRNLERHARPPRPFLLDEGEAIRLVAGLEILHHEEGWLAEGRHDALVIARRKG